MDLSLSLSWHGLRIDVLYVAVALVVVDLAVAVAVTVTVHAARRCRCEIDRCFLVTDSQHRKCRVTVLCWTRQCQTPNTNGFYSTWACVFVRCCHMLYIHLYVYIFILNYLVKTFLPIGRLYRRDRARTCETHSILSTLFLSLVLVYRKTKRMQRL